MTSMQDSYIGNTTASQAVKAGSTPVSCSKTKDHPLGGLSFWNRPGNGNIFVMDNSLVAAVLLCRTNPLPLEDPDFLCVAQGFPDVRIQCDLTGFKQQYDG